MSCSLAARVATVTLAVLMAGRTAVPLSVLAQDTEAPSWRVPNASDAGAWKAVGANTAPDPESQITFEYMGADSNVPLLTVDGKLAIRRGVDPIGAHNHPEVNIVATQTAEGFKSEPFDPGHSSAEFTCTVSTDGATLSCAHRAMFNERQPRDDAGVTSMSAEGKTAPSLPLSPAGPDALQPITATPPALLPFESLEPPTAYNQTANHRSVWDLQYWHNRIYIGHGDWDANTGPVQAIYFDVGSGAFVHDQDFLFDDEAIETYRVISDILIAVGADAKEGWELGNIYARSWDTSWEKIRGLPRGVHVFDIAPAGSSFIAVGSDEHAAGLVWKARQGLKDWTISNSFTGSSAIPFKSPALVHGGAFELDNKTYVTTANGQCLVYAKDSWSTSDCTDSYDFGVYKNAIFNGVAVMVPYAHGNVRPDNRLQMYNGQEKWSVRFQSSVRDALVTDEGLFILVGGVSGDGAIFHATTLGCRCSDDFAQIGQLSNGPGGTPYSLEYAAGHFYVGLADGRLLRSVIPQ